MLAAVVTHSGLLTKGRVHLVKILAIKGWKVSKEKLQFVQIQVCYLGHFISEQWLLHLEANRFQGILIFPNQMSVAGFSRAGWLLLQVDPKRARGAAPVSHTEAQQSWAHCVGWPR